MWKFRVQLEVEVQVREEWADTLDQALDCVSDVTRDAVICDINHGSIGTKVTDYVVTKLEENK